MSAGTHAAGLSPAQLRSVDRTLAVGTWSITSGAVLFSVLTVTPLVMRVTPAGWGWTAPILPVVVDAAVVIVVRLDAVVARLGADGGRWPAVLRWMTGLMTLLLNTGDSLLEGDWVGVAVHSVAPLLLIVTAEATLAYRRAISRALAALERSRAEEREERERRRAAREQREREERERSRREAREHAERLERERFEREAAERRAERESAAQVRREEQEREHRMHREEQEREDRIRREEQERAERVREREARTDEDRGHSRGAHVNTPDGAVNAAVPETVNSVPAHRKKLTEDEALKRIRAEENAGRSLRELAEETGWSLGWVAARRQECRGAAEHAA